MLWNNLYKLTIPVFSPNAKCHNAKPTIVNIVGLALWHLAFGENMEFQLSQKRDNTLIVRVLCKIRYGISLS